MSSPPDDSFITWMSDKTFLVVEDMSSSRMLESSLLRGLGAKTVVAAVDGMDAMAKMEGGSVRPDIIICDWIMPGLDGMGVLDGAKRLIPGVKVIMVTAKTELSDVKVAHDHGADGYVAKPFTKDALVAALKRIQG
jgi:two-component system chemotaxis response regulator CheY